ncbi:Trigger factor [Candidatus Bealeia paramacronuclearis]|uniref:Trigger factor n=1 Tax=Candidatus Bealeia paramacronuclearis TaxID=1921001 RepID=A0ABZ2C3G2_9PROT|nr:Trigger factor [Candidatus Bealeia paramacronuclearis]
MDIKLTLTDGLKREFSIIVPAQEVSGKIDAVLKEIGKKVKIAGFRPGKVPLPILKKNYLGKAFEDTIEHFANDATRKIVDEHKIQPAITPKYDIKSAEPEKDLAFEIKIEILPEIDEAKIEGLKFEKLSPEVEKELIEEAVKKLSEAQPPLKAIEKDRKVKKGDFLIVDIETENLKTHKLEKAERLLVKVDENDMGGFEMKLVGAEKGQTLNIEHNFPADHPIPEFAGKLIPFSITVHEIQEADEKGLNDDWAKNRGFETLDKLKTAIEGRLVEEAAFLAYQRVKRHVLDALAEAHTFDIPPTMVDMEFDVIWHQLMHELNVDCGHHEHANHNHEVEYKTVEEASGLKEEDLKKQYRDIAERRVRLGLLLADIGRKNNVTVPREALSRAVMEKARQYPGQEKQVFDYYTKNERAMASLRAPLFEDKVIEFILSKADVKEIKKPTKEVIELCTKELDNDDSVKKAKPKASEKPKKETKK